MVPEQMSTPKLLSFFEVPFVSLTASSLLELKLLLRHRGLLFLLGRDRFNRPSSSCPLGDSVDIIWLWSHAYLGTELRLQAGDNSRNFPLARLMTVLVAIICTVGIGICMGEQQTLGWGCDAQPRFLVRQEGRTRRTRKTERCAGLVLITRCSPPFRCVQNSLITCLISSFIQQDLASFDQLNEARNRPIRCGCAHGARRHD